MKSPKLKSDRFKKARGGASRLLHLACQACGTDVMRYQKDGPGALKRLYLDRIVDASPVIASDNFVCKNCGQILGVPMTYEKENRAAIRLIPGALKKSIVKNKKTAG